MPNPFPGEAVARPANPRGWKRRLVGTFVACAVAVTVLAFAAPADASTALPPTANAIRSAGGKVVLLVDGKPVTRGQIVRGRHVEARVYVPRVRFTGPVVLFLADYQTTSFELAESNQRLLQSVSVAAVPGQWTVLKLKVRCKMRTRCYRTGKLRKHQLDVGVGQPIGKPFKWLGTYPHYTSQQFLGATFVKARCWRPHPKPCRCRRG